jgi:two-component system sensor histidine kinase KdpD
MSHEVRTPLTALVGLAESLEHSTPPLANGQAASARAISQEARQLNALVTNLLDMARLQSGQVNLRSDWHSIEELVGSAIRAAHHALGDVVVRTDVPADLPLVEFDAALMERVLVNLLENAAKYGVCTAPDARPILVSARVTPTTLVMAVRDHGPGLPPSSKGQEQTLFEKFTRGKAESATPGVGLGLAICKAVVEAHGGHITAAQALGGGAEFILTLPRMPPPELPVADGD